MKQYRVEAKEVNVIELCICDVCKKEIRPADFVEYQEMWSYSTIGGFGSLFGDCADMSLDMCQCCVQKLLGKYIQFD